MHPQSPALRALAEKWDAVPAGSRRRCAARVVAGVRAPLLPGLLMLALAGCARAFSEAEYGAFLTASDAYLRERQARLDSVFALGTYSRYDWDQGSGRITFSDSGMVKVIADIQFVGSVSARSGTWLWAWDNPGVTREMGRAARRVRRFGQRHGIHALTEARWPADQVDGWEMTSIAARVTGAEGAYRSPSEAGATFLLLTNVRWAGNPVVRAPAQP